jgi:hypothetical protein
MKSTLKMILAVIGIIALSAVSKHIAALQLVEQTLAANRNILLAFIVPVVALGLILFMGGLMLMLYEKGKPMSHSEVEEQVRITQNLGIAPYGSRRSAYRVFGKGVGRQFYEELALRDFKIAWQSSAWRHDKLWRYRFVVFTGALMAIFGGLATAAVLAPIALSLVCVSALIYAAVQLSWALSRA